MSGKPSRFALQLVVLFHQLSIRFLSELPESLLHALEMQRDQSFAYMRT